MKAKACARCRQSKVRCDSDVTAPGPCSRCKDLGERCVVDFSYRRENRHQRIRELEAEVARLRQVSAAAHDGSPSPQGLNSRTASAVAAATPSTSQTDQDPPPRGPRLLPKIRQVVPESASSSMSPTAATEFTSAKELCGLRWSSAQAAESFHIFFTNCHPYLQLPLPTDPEHTFHKCPLLFWVICAVTSPPTSMLQLQPGISDMIAQVTTRPTRSIEVVQALLILCMWPFPFSRTLDDPSFIYCGIATRIGLQIGLHRPGRQAEFSSRQEVLAVGEHARRTTWVACYIVNQMQSVRLGVPSTIQADYALNEIVEGSDIAPVLATLFRISRLTVQFCDLIGAKGRTWSGLQEPQVRLDMVNHFSGELDALRQRHLSTMTEPVEIAFLTSRLHLLSFIFHDDMPRSPDLVGLFHQAEKDATDLIMRSSDKNLSRCPWHIARAVLFAALILVKLRASPYVTQPVIIADRITLASQMLQTAVKTEDDHAQRWANNLMTLLNIHDRKRTKQIQSRMGASLLYDTIRVLREHLSEQAAMNSDREDRSLDWLTAEGVGDDQLLGFDMSDWQELQVMGGLL